MTKSKAGHTKSDAFLQFGALAPKFDDQPVVAVLTQEQRDGFQKSADAITHLRFAGGLTYTEANRARDRIAKLICVALSKAKGQP